MPCRKIKAIFLLAMLVAAHARDVKHNLRFSNGVGIKSKNFASSARGVSSKLGERGSDFEGEIFAQEIKAIIAGLSCQEEMTDIMVDPEFQREVKHAVQQVEALGSDVYEAKSVTKSGVDATTQPRRLQAKAEEFSNQTSARNVKLASYWWALNGLWFGISLSTMGSGVFTKYLYELGGGKNSVVGDLATVGGASSLACSIPVGILVDHRPESRARLCKVAFVFGILTTVGITMAVLFDSLPLIYASVVVRSIFYELSGSVTRAIITDSVPIGNRTKIFTKQAITGTVFGAIGPLFQAAGFYALGNKWTTRELKLVNVIGNLILPFACVTLLFFKDPPSAETKSKQDSKQDGHGVVPCLLSGNTFIRVFASGLSVTLFSLFWIQDIQLTPAGISWLGVVTPFFCAMFMPIASILAKYLGRAQVVLLFTSATIPMMVGIAKCHSTIGLLALYFLRWGFSFATMPASGSILADFTPSSNRGKWNALFTLVQHSPMAISAFIGGRLADAHGYRFVFLISAAVQALAALVWLPLLKLVPRTEGGQTRTMSSDPKQNKLARTEEATNRASNAATNKESSAFLGIASIPAAVLIGFFAGVGAVFSVTRVDRTAWIAGRAPFLEPC